MEVRFAATGLGPTLEEIVHARKACNHERVCRDSIDDFLLTALNPKLARDVWRRFCRGEDW